MKSAADPVGQQYPHRERVISYFRRRAAEVDGGGCDVRDGLRLLGEHGLLDLDLPSSVALIEDIAAECLSSAFAVWAQRMVIEYLARAVTADPADELRSGRMVGATAMAPALRDVAGIQPVPVLATRTADGLRLNGPISWASNLFPGALVVLPVRLSGDARAVVRLRTTDDGVRVAPAPDLLVLNGTASSSVTLDDVHIGRDAVLTEDLPGFVAAIRPTFLLLQTAYCSGLAGRSLAETGTRTVGVNAAFAEQVDALSTAHESVRQRLYDYATRSDQVAVPDLLRLRLEGVQVAVAATRLEATVRGGAGYLAASDTSRRLREAAFLPIQAPTEGQLRWELSRFN
ncbi:hypothetical protein TH66_02280 [Carbonactinospora thermoautotrophica]|uniref:Acyl-CoA dehydrogenase n=1 Tax=Carbonactinospora thermoautotrophica TaxID=1469144 RepID=A0A132MUW4_9ACTN|nr:acyl-CoA dehydrogenase family protein [Carbonactinospora thermoautotrophica]KWX01162.1 Acyl-CoA dehydrogenase [Carbonactinospora thermoautotrophica]KWX05429.1 hypothetical protein TR74_23740 [Carbonactinospora thermoautotrophica]KWX05520.1 hypothetical protein TH66_02280 [Carbonactinospora thermoautotrophica]